MLQALTRANISDSLCFEALTDRSSPLQKSRLEALEARQKWTILVRQKCHSADQSSCSILHRSVQIAIQRARVKHATHAQQTKLCGCFWCVIWSNPNCEVNRFNRRRATIRISTGLVSSFVSCWFLGIPWTGGARRIESWRAFPAFAHAERWPRTTRGEWRDRKRIETGRENN